MVRTYKRKSDRQKWSEESMEKAIVEVISGTMGYKKAANSYNLPQSTLDDRVKKRRGGSSLEEASRKGMGNFKCIFSMEQEAELVEYVKHMESRLFGLTTTELRRVAFQLAERNQLQPKFNIETQKAGLDWLKGFLKRHQDLSLRCPEPTSAARAMGFNKVVVGQFFDLLISLTDKYQFRPTRIYNVDETGLTTVPKSNSKVIAMKGRRQVGTLSSGERGQLVTTVFAFSAAGHYVPPFFIFPRVRMKAELLDGAPAEAAAACHPSGWMQANIFVEWMEHFIKHVKPTKEDPVLVILYGHATHTKNLDLIDLARHNGVILLCLPPHCTQKLQRLDVSFMAPLSTFYGQEVKSWLRANPGRVVTQYQIGSLLGLAYNRGATIQTAVSGFKKTGIYPVNRNVFDEFDFAAAETTEREEQATNNDVPENGPPSPAPQVNASKSPTPTLQPSEINLEQIFETTELKKRTDDFEFIPTLEVPTARSPSPIAGPSRIHLKPAIHTDAISCQNRTIKELTPERCIPSANSSEFQSIKSSSFYSKTRPSSFAFSPKDILPIPHAPRKVATARRGRGKTAILTESPYKKELEQNIAVKTNAVRIKQVKRKVVIQRGSKSKKSVKSRKPSIVEETRSNSEEEDEDSQDSICIYCKDAYSKTNKNDGWVKCTNNCNNWAHEGCTGLPEEDLDGFICQECEFNNGME